MLCYICVPWPWQFSVLIIVNFGLFSLGSGMVKCGIKQFLHLSLISLSRVSWNLSTSLFRASLWSIVLGSRNPVLLAGNLYVTCTETPPASPFSINPLAVCWQGLEQRSLIPFCGLRLLSTQDISRSRT